MTHPTLPRRIVLVLALALLAPAGAGAVEPAARPTHDELVKLGLKATPEAMEWWRDAKFGVFIHWGVGVEKRHAPWASRTDQVYWDNLFANLKHVTKYDPEEWIGLVKAGGGKYVVMTTRLNGAMHRRPTGNLLFWDSKTSDNKLTHPQSPFRRDVCKEIADAAHKLGVELEWYSGGIVGEGMWELLSNYGPVRGVWFDGGAPAPGMTAEDVYAKMRKLQPGILINGGIGGKYGGDYDTPQHDPGWPGWHGRPVETAAILRNGYWYWDKPNKPVKSLKQCVDLLMRCVGNGGNLVLNLAPKPDGSMEANEVHRLKELGAWLGKYGRSVYATRPGPFAPTDWGVTTRDKAGPTVYLHVLNDLDGGKLALPPITAKVTAASLLNNPAVKVDFTQSPAGLTVFIPHAGIDKLDTIVALTLDGPAMSARLAPPPILPVSQGKPVSATSTFVLPGNPVVNERLNGPANAVDGDPLTFWCSHAGGDDAKPGPKFRYLHVDLGKPAAVDRAFVSTFMGIAAISRTVQQFTIEYQSGDKWLPLADSSSLGPRGKTHWSHSLSFPATTAQHFRLGVTGPETTVYEFQLFAAGTGH